MGIIGAVCEICGSVEHSTAQHTAPRTEEGHSSIAPPDGCGFCGSLKHATEKHPGAREVSGGTLRGMNGGKKSSAPRAAVPQDPGVGWVGQDGSYGRMYPPGHPAAPPMPPPPTEEEHKAKQRELDQLATVRLARDLVVAHPTLDVARAFAIADEFAAETVRRIPHTTMGEQERRSWVDSFYGGATIGRRFGDAGSR